MLSPKKTTVSPSCRWKCCVPPAETPNPETALLLAERAAALRKSLEELPPEYREVLVSSTAGTGTTLKPGDRGNHRNSLWYGESRLNRGRQRLQQALLNYAERGAIDAV